MEGVEGKKEEKQRFFWPVQNLEIPPRASHEKEFEGAWQESQEAGEGRGSHNVAPRLGQPAASSTLKGALRHGPLRHREGTQTRLKCRVF